MLRFSEQIISHGFFLHRVEGKAKRIQSKISKNGLASYCNFSVL